MRFVVSIFVLTMSLVLFAGCSGTPGTNVSDANTASGLPEYTDANTALAEGTTFLDTDEVDKAIAALNQAVKLNPDLAEAYFKLGISYALVETRDSLNLKARPDQTSDSNEEKRKEKKPNSEIAFEKAVEAYKKVVEANPEDHQAHFNLGLAYNKLDEDRNAEKALRQAVKLNPEDSLYQTELGSILIKLAEYREAIGPLKKALELDPDNIEAEELLEDAEAGRQRIDYRSTPKPGSSNSNSNTSSSNSSVPTEKPTPAAQRTPEARRTPASNRNKRPQTVSFLPSVFRLCISLTLVCQKSR
jgi:tetratricopeptide (TPR) repeat protein